MQTQFENLQTLGPIVILYGAVFDNKLYSLDCHTVLISLLDYRTQDKCLFPFCYEQIYVEQCGKRAQPETAHNGNQQTGSTSSTVIRRRASDRKC